MAIQIHETDLLRKDIQRSIESILGDSDKYIKKRLELFAEFVEGAEATAGDLLSIKDSDPAVSMRECLAGKRRRRALDMVGLLLARLCASSKV